MGHLDESLQIPPTPKNIRKKESIRGKINIKAPVNSFHNLCIALCNVAEFSEIKAIRTGKQRMQQYLVLMLIIGSNAFVSFHSPQLEQAITTWNGNSMRLFMESAKFIRSKNTNSPQETNWVPRAMNDALSTLDVCPSNVFKQEPSAIAHNFIVLSPEAVKTH